MSLQTDIKAEMIEAMKAKDQVRLSVIRSLMTAFMNELVATKRTPQDELSDEEVLKVIGRAAKQRKDSIEQFEKGGRADLAESEKEELSILESYLPVQMTKEEIEGYVKDKISSENPDKEKKNQFMGMIMKELKGRADGTLVKETVDSLLQ